ncbi:Methionine aminopeptidase [Clostridiaceae bacterium JG1575]|nr:Methionine aminopeptidase [Clostridiaceae bacterium JG1575]
MIILKNKRELDAMAESGRIVEEALLYVASLVRPGISTWELDRLAEEFITKQGAVPSFKGYGGFPGSICTSVNDVVIHGIPARDTILQEGDILSVDLGALKNHYHGDAARTIPVGSVTQEALRLIRTTEEAFFCGLDHCRIGHHLSDISHAIETHVRQAGCSIVEEYVGHGIGRNLHEMPNVPNFGAPGRGPRLQEGMVIAIEPMVNLGRRDIVVLKDRWTVKTRDGSLSAHYENTVAITEDGPRMLTCTQRR